MPEDSNPVESVVGVDKKILLPWTYTDKRIAWRKSSGEKGY
jgi:hypothetical protein